MKIAAKRLILSGIVALFILGILCLNVTSGNTPTVPKDNSGQVASSPLPTASQEPAAPSPSPIAQIDPEKAAYLVVIDAGHGAHDPGTNTDKLLEKDIVLDVTLRLDAILKSRGITTCLTRSDDTFLELEDRIAIANSKKAALFISIHVDYYEDPSVNGSTTYYYHADRLSTGNLTELDYASVIQEELIKSADTRDRGIKKQNYAVLRLAEVPAVLVEMGYINGNVDAALLASPDFRQKAAEGLANGIERALDRIK